MNKFSFALILIGLTITGPTYAQTQEPHAVGNMFTTALNLIQTLNALEPQKYTSITSIHVDHGQVFVIMAGDNGPVTVIYDPIAHQIVSKEHSK